MLLPFKYTGGSADLMALAEGQTSPRDKHQWHRAAIPPGLLSSGGGLHTLGGLFDKTRDSLWLRHVDGIQSRFGLKQPVSEPYPADVHDYRQGGHETDPFSVRPSSACSVLSPSPLALPHHFVQIRRWTYLDRSKSILKAWEL